MINLLGLLPYNNSSGSDTMPDGQPFASLRLCERLLSACLHQFTTAPWERSMSVRKKNGALWSACPRSLPHAKPREELPDHLFPGILPGDLAQRGGCRHQVYRQQFLGAAGVQRGSCLRQRLPARAAASRCRRVASAAYLNGRVRRAADRAAPLQRGQTFASEGGELHHRPAPTSSGVICAGRSLCSAPLSPGVPAPPPAALAIIGQRLRAIQHQQRRVRRSSAARLRSTPSRSTGSSVWRMPAVSSRRSGIPASSSAPRSRRAWCRAPR